MTPDLQNGGGVEASSAMDRKLSFVIVGCGTIAPVHARALRALPESAEIAGFCDVDAARATALVAEFGGRVFAWSELLADPGVDAATICTPSGMHAAQAAELLRAGKHVVVEKPFDVRAEACLPALDAARTSGKTLGVVSQHRFDPASRKVEGWIREGKLGRLFGVDVRIPWFRTQEYYDSGEWRGTWEMDGGGCLMNQGVHTVDLMLWLAGPVKRLWSRSRTAVHERIQVEDHVCAALEFENGAIGTLVASTATYPGFPARLDLMGTGGTVVIEGDELHTVALRGRETEHGSAHAHARQVASGGTKGATEESTGQELGRQWVWGDAHRAQFEDFVAACRGNRPPLMGGEDGRRAVALIEAVYTSARTGRVVEL